VIIKLGVRPWPLTPLFFLKVGWKTLPQRSLGKAQDHPHFFLQSGEKS
jgi:hypothetical protein